MKHLKTLIIALTLVFSIFTIETTAYATEYLTITYFEDADFTIWGAVETTVLTMDADTISITAYCENDIPETVLCHIEGKTNPEYNLTIPFDADGTCWTFPYDIPEGRYFVYFTGSTTNIKTYAIVSFTVFVD